MCQSDAESGSDLQGMKSVSRFRLEEVWRNVAKIPEYQSTYLLSLLWMKPWSVTVAVPDLGSESPETQLPRYIGTVRLYGVM